MVIQRECCASLPGCCRNDQRSSISIILAESASYHAVDIPRAVLLRSRSSFRSAWACAPIQHHPVLSSRPPTRTISLLDSDPLSAAIQPDAKPTVRAVWVVPCTHRAGTYLIQHGGPWRICRPDLFAKVRPFVCTTRGTGNARSLGALPCRSPCSQSWQRVPASLVFYGSTLELRIANHDCSRCFRSALRRLSGSSDEVRTWSEHLRLHAAPRTTSPLTASG